MFIDNFPSIFTELDQFVEPLRTTCTLKVKPNAVKQEYEKQEELKRSALRALAALASIPKAGKRSFYNFPWLNLFKTRFAHKSYSYT